MQVKKKEIEERILNSAKTEFMKNGYYHSSITRIAKMSDVPIGNLYRYFDGKKDLFKKLLTTVYNFLPQFIADLAGTAIVLTMPLEQFATFIAKELFKVFMKYNSELQILFFRCDGTDCADFRSKIDEQILDIVIKRNFGDGKVTEAESFMSNVVSQGYLTGLLELFRHELDENKFTELIQKITLFFFKDFKKRG